jgi:hypothetical protein
MTTKIPVELSSTPGIVDSSNATAITIDSSENISINSGDVTLATASKRYYVPRASDAAATGSLYSPADSDIRLSGAGSSAGEIQFEASSTSGVTMKVLSSGAVDIGGSETAHANTDDLIVGAYSGNHGIQINAENTGNSSIFFGDNNSTLIGQLEYVHASDYLAIVTGGAQRARIDSDGLKFGSDSAAANALDDYEEGTWTPAVASDASASAYNYRNGYYTKIGRQVRVTCQFRISTIGSFSGATINLQGLPYNIGNHSNYDPIGVIMIKSAATAKNDIYVRGVSNSNYVRIESNNGNTSSDRNCNANMFDTDTICFMDFTYFIA